MKLVIHVPGVVPSRELCPHHVAIAAGLGKFVKCHNHFLVNPSWFGNAPFVMDPVI